MDGNRSMFVMIVAKFAEGTKATLQKSLSAMKGLWAPVKTKLLKAESKAQLKKDLESIKGLTTPTRLKIDKKTANKELKEQSKSLNDIYLNANVTLDKKKIQKQIDKDLSGINAGRWKLTIPPATGTPTSTPVSAPSVPKSSGFSFSKLKDGISAIFGFEGSLRRLIRMVGDATRQLKAIDTQMTEISKTANLTKKEMLELGNAAFDSANKFGQTVNQYLEGANTFAQAGKKNVAELAELSLMAQSAGNMQASLSDEYLLATDAAYGFQGSVEKLTQVLDGQNQVTNRNAVDMSKIAEAVKITGSQAAQSSVEIDEMTAAISTMATVTQMSGSEVGRAFKGILMNLQKVKGEVVDGEIIDEDALSKSEKALESVGISLKEMHDGILTLRDPMQVIKELSAAFMALDENDARRANIIESIGGKYRGNQLTALLSNYDMYEKILADYSDSTGSALRESQKTANSWQGLTNQLSNSWIEFVGGFVNTDWVKGSLSGLNSMVQAFDGLNKAGVFIPALTGSVIALQATLNKDFGITQFKNKATGKIDIQGNMFGIDFTAIAKQKQHFSDAANMIQNWNAEIKTGTADISTFGGELVKNNKDFKTYLSTTKDGSASLTGYKASLKAAGISTDALRLKTIALNAIVGLGIGVAIQGVIMGVQALADAYVTLAEQQEKVNEAAENYAAVQSEIASLNNELKTTNDQITELNNQDNLTLLDKDELSNLRESNTELATRIALLEKEEEIAAKKLGKESVELFDRTFSDVDFSEAKVNEYQSGAKTSGNNAILVSDENDIAAMIAAYKQFAELRSQANNPEDIQHFSDVIGDIEESLLGSANTLQSTKENLSALNNPSEDQLAIIEKSKTGLDMINSLIMPEKWKSIKFSEIFNSDDMEATKENLMELSQQGKLDEGAINSYGELSSKLTDAKITASEAVTEINALNTVLSDTAVSGFTAILDANAESVKKLNQEIDSVQSAYQTLSSAIADYTDKGYMSVDSMQSVIALGDDYIGLLFDENGQLKLNKESLVALTEARLDELEAEALANAIKNVQALTDEATATEYLTGKTKESTEATKADNEALLEKIVLEKTANGGNMAAATQLIVETFNQYKSVIDMTRSSLNGYTDETMGAASATDTLNNTLKAEGEAGIRVIDRKIKALQDAQKASEKRIDAEIKGINEEKKAYEDAINKELDLLNDRKEALEEDLNKNNDAASAVIDFLNKQIEALNKQKDEISKTYNDEIAALDKTNDELQKKLDLENALEEVEKDKNQKVRIFKDGKFGYGDNQDAIGDAQDNYDQIKADQELQAKKDLLAEERDAKIKALEEEIKRQEEYRKLWEESTEAYQREQELKHALEVLGVGWEDAIAAQRTDILEKFAEEHYNKTVELQDNVLTQIDTLTQQKEAELAIFEERIAELEREKELEAENYAARIETLNGYKDQIQERLSMIGQSWADYNASLKAEAAWEEALYGDMTAQINAWADSVEEAVRRAEEARASAGAPKYKGDGPSKTSTHNPSDDYYEKKNNVDKGRLDRLASGGTAQYTGVHVKDEDGPELKLPALTHGKYRRLEMGDDIVPARPSEILMDFAAHPAYFIEKLMPSLRNFNSVPVMNSNVSQPTINIGDINITQPIGDIKGLSREIKRKLPRQIIQDMHNS